MRKTASCLFYGGPEDDHFIKIGSDKLGKFPDIIEFIHEDISPCRIQNLSNIIPEEMKLRKIQYLRDVEGNYGARY